MPDSISAILFDKIVLLIYSHTWAHWQTLQSEQCTSILLGWDNSLWSLDLMLIMIDLTITTSPDKRRYAWQYISYLIWQDCSVDLWSHLGALADFAIGSCQYIAGYGWYVWQQHCHCARWVTTYYCRYANMMVYWKSHLHSLLIYSFIKFSAFG
jgi:hypothetical protein